MDSRSSSDTNLTTPSRPSRRSVLALALSLALGGVVGPAVLAATAKTKLKRQAKRAGRRPARRRPQRRPRYKVVTRTFASTVPITIPEEGAGSPYPSIIQIKGLRAGSILDVNVTLSNLSHTYPEDLEVVLVAPNRQVAVVLMSEVGGSDGVTNVTLAFDDQAASWLPFEQQIVSGAFKPTLPGGAPRPDTATLRSFNGFNPNGAWRLYVADGAGGGMGSIGGWALTIRARVRV